MLASRRILQGGTSAFNRIRLIRQNAGIGQFPSGNTVVFQPTAAAEAGHKVTLQVNSFAGGSGSYQAVSTITDTAGNTWMMDNAAGAPDARTVVSMCSSNLTAPITTSSAITVTFNGTLGSGSTVSLLMYEWSFPNVASGVDKTGGAATSFARTNNVQLSAVTTNATELIITGLSFSTGPGVVSGPVGYGKLTDGLFYLLPTTKQRFVSNVSWTNNANVAQSMVAYLP
jgi:uncharacterized protein (DUF2141 family)